MLLGSSALDLQADREGSNKREREAGFYVCGCVMEFTAQGGGGGSGPPNQRPMPRRIKNNRK
jgi:hypothetical protein